MPLQELKDRGTLPGDPRGSVIAGRPGHPRMSPCARPCSGKEGAAEREDCPPSLVQLCSPCAGGAAALLPQPLGGAGEVARTCPARPRGAISSFGITRLLSFSPTGNCKSCSSASAINKHCFYHHYSNNCNLIIANTLSGNIHSGEHISTSVFVGYSCSVGSPPRLLETTEDSHLS